MCKLLNLSRSLIYKRKDSPKTDSELEDLIIEIFNSNRKAYGTRKIKEGLGRRGLQVSRRRIARIMKKYSLVSNYTTKKYKKPSSDVNNEKVQNIVNRNFDRDTQLEVIVSDLTYVRVGNKWNYICTIIDLFNREIIGYSCGENKDANLVLKAFATINHPIDKIQIFHTDRGREFKNKAIDDLWELRTKLMDYVNWYNNIRFHGSLNYMTPVEFRKSMFVKKVS